MLSSYIVTAFRNLWRHRIYSFANIFSFAVGIAFFSLIFLYVRYETQYDKHHAHADRIYRIIQFIEHDGVGERSASLPYPFVDKLAEKHPGVIENAVRIFNWQAPSTAIKSSFYYGEESHFYFADSNFFEMFDYQFVIGDRATAFDSAKSVVISSKAAEKYFGDHDPLGKTLTYGNGTKLQVTGVVNEKIHSSHFTFDFLVPISTVINVEQHINERFAKEWVWNPFWTYVLLAEGKTVAEVEFLFPDIASEYMQGMLSSVSFYLQPLREIHLYSDLDYELEKNGSIWQLYIFVTIALMVLVLAVINFSNLTTSRLAVRAKEIGVRKALGADFNRLLFQLQVELIVLGAVAMLLALVIVELSLPVFFGRLGIVYTISSEDVLPSVLIVLLVTGLVGFISGIYPAVYLSQLNPQETLQKSTLLSIKGKGVRNSMIILQLVIIFFMLNTTFTVQQQYRFLSNVKMGFEREHILCVPMAYSPLARQFDDFRKKLLTVPGVRGVTSCETLPGVNHQTVEFTPVSKDSLGMMFFPSLMTGHGFTQTMGIQIIAGKDYPSDSLVIEGSTLINRRMTQFLGFEHPKDALGLEFRFATDKYKKVIGVMEDFHFESLENEIAPFVLYEVAQQQDKFFFGRYILVNYHPTQKAQVLKEMETLWSSYMEERPFVHFDLDQKLKEVYQDEQKLSIVATTFAGISLLIAGFGLFGISYFAMEQRRKEVAIRKALGATQSEVFLLLLKNFIWLVTVSLLIAFPVSWMVLNNWLDTYSYSIKLNLGSFVLTGASIFIFMVITILYHIYKASLLQPIFALKK